MIIFLICWVKIGIKINLTYFFGLLKRGLLGYLKLHMWFALYLLDSTVLNCLPEADPRDDHCVPSERRKVWIEGAMKEEGLGHWPSLV